MTNGQISPCIVGLHCAQEAGGCGVVVTAGHVS